MESIKERLEIIKDLSTDQLRNFSKMFVNALGDNAHKELTVEVIIRYTNHRGETRDRRVAPLFIHFSKSEWHPETQWMLDAHDVEKDAIRSFALSDIQSWTPLSKACVEVDLVEEKEHREPETISVLRAKALAAMEAIERKVAASRDTAEAESRGFLE